LIIEGIIKNHGYPAWLLPSSVFNFRRIYSRRGTFRLDRLLCAYCRAWNARYLILPFMLDFPLLKLCHSGPSMGYSYC
jgi:hypothetical protein